MKKIVVGCTAVLLLVLPVLAMAQQDFEDRTAGMVGSTVGILVILGIYIYTAMCLMTIANKTGTENSWMAWVPIANVFLMCRIASLSYVWVCCLLVGMIPIVGPPLMLGAFGYIYYKIALARNKPGWMGVCTIIPVAGWVFLGLLAFSD